MLAPLEDRATLCESQRTLAQLLFAEGQVDEAERFALAARETVGPADHSLRRPHGARVVRAAQGRDDEAEELLREAYDRRRQRTTGSRVETLEALAQFLRERGREDEAGELDERRASSAWPPRQSAARIA